MTGYFADRNEVAESPCAISSNAAWAASGPLDSMKTTPLIDAAVCTVLGTAAEPVTIDILFDDPVFITYAGLFDTNLRQSSFVRLDAFADDAGAERLFTTVNAAGRDRRVMPPLTDPARLRFGAPNQMRGDLEPRDFRLYPTNIHVVVPLARVRLLRWSLWGGAYQPDDSDAPGYSIGLAWAGDGIALERHLGGSSEGIRSNDQVITSPDGAAWVEAGVTKRSSAVDQAAFGAATRDALFDSAHRAGRRKPLVWLPDVDDAAACFRYGGLFRRANDHTHKYLSPAYAGGTTIELEEWRE
jgi:hypothetical protein